MNVKCFFSAALCLIFISSSASASASEHHDFSAIKDNIIPAIQRLIESKQYDAAISLSNNFSYSNDSDLLDLNSLAKEKKYLSLLDGISKDDFYSLYSMYEKLYAISKDKEHLNKRDFFRAKMNDRNISSWGIGLIEGDYGNPIADFKMLYPEAGYISYKKGKYETSEEFSERVKPKYEGLSVIEFKPRHSYNPDSHDLSLYIEVYDSKLDFVFLLSDANNNGEYYYNSRHSNLMDKSFGVKLSHSYRVDLMGDELLNDYYLYSDDFPKLKGNNCSLIENNSYSGKIGINFEASVNRAKYLENYASVFFLIKKPINHHNFAYTYDKVRSFYNGRYNQAESHKYYMLSEVLGFVIFDKLKNIIILECKR